MVITRNRIVVLIFPRIFQCTVVVISSGVRSIDNKAAAAAAAASGRDD